MAVETRVQVTMPQMGESVTEGVVLEWHVKEGDHVASDDVLVEISTDKVDAEVPSPASGVVVAVGPAEGDTVAVGSLLCEIESGDVDGAPAVADDAPAAEADGPVELIEITMPAMGESVTEGTVLEWAKSVGDAIAQDETLVEISTDKVDAEVPSPASGTVAEILVQAGDTVTVGQVLARLQSSGHTRTQSVGRSAPTAAPTNGAAPAAPAAAPVAAPSNGDIVATPVARRIAAATGVDIARVAGTGPNGRVTKADVLNGESAAAPAAAPGELIKGGAAMLARYMDESRAIPTATSFRTMTVTVMDGRRKQLKQGGQKVSFTHLIAYAIAKAATDEMPVMAHHFEERDGKPYRLDDGAVNLGIAVDVEKKDGSRTLMVPVIKDAGRLTFTQFLDAFNDLIARARENKLTADDLTGANISLTNPGGIGTVASVPRLMVGQGTIVATGSIAYPVGLGAIGELIGAEKVMSMTSTYDHRVIQGAESGRFLQVVEAYLQGEHGFYEGVFGDLGVQLGPTPAPPAPAAAAGVARDAASTQTPVAAGAPDEALLQAVQAATAIIKAYRTHGHLAARLDPLGTEPEGDPSLDPGPLGPDRGPAEAHPGQDPAHRRSRRDARTTRCRTCARPTPARSPTRSSTSPATASARGCARRSRPAPTATR